MNVALVVLVMGVLAGCDEAGTGGGAAADTDSTPVDDGGETSGDGGDSGSEVILVLTESTSSFSGVENSDSAFGDLDGDGHHDLVITGLNASSDPVTEVYMNDGSGNFTKDTDASGDLIDVYNSAVVLADLDGDGDLDVVLTGYTGNSGSTNSGTIATVYTNDGDGRFTEVANQGASAVLFGNGSTDESGEKADTFGMQNASIAIGDLDGDDKLDIVFTGLASGSGESSSPAGAVRLVYKNTWGGEFHFSRRSTDVGVTNGDVALEDLDDDGDLDWVIAGFESGATNNRSAEIYRVEPGDTETPYSTQATAAGENLADAQDAAMAIADVDGNGHLDIVVAGFNGFTYYAHLYRNNGDLSDSENLENDGSVDLRGGKFSATAFADFDQDGDEDLIITGQYNAEEDEHASIYLNDGDGGFAEAPDGSGVTPVSNGSVGVADVNGDGYPDLLVTGVDADGDRTSTLYVNHSGN